MSLRAFLASALSLLVPGLGQVYAGKRERGAAILVAAIVVGNQYAIWLSLFAATPPEARSFASFTLPLILHRVSSAWGSCSGSGRWWMPAGRPVDRQGAKG